MKNEIGFRIVCTCGCLSIRIEEPLKASREAIVYCGDCGASRGTVGALRDLAVQRHPEVIPLMPSTVSPAHTSDDLHGQELSKRYTELRRLRRQVEIAESLAHASSKPSAINRTRAG